MAAATQVMPVWRTSSHFSGVEYDARAHSPYGLPIADDSASRTLSGNSIFSVLSADSLRDLDRISHTNSYPAGAMLVVEGQSPRGVYILCHGQAKLMTTNQDGKTLILRIAQPGEILGIDAVISARPYEFTVETLHASQLAFIGREDFLRFLRNHTDACLCAAQHLSRDCQSAYDSIRSIGLSHSVPEKLARLLLTWAADTKPTGGTIRFKLALTHEEMAQLIGSSRETVTRILSDFKRRHLLELQGSTMVLRDKAALEKLAAV